MSDWNACIADRDHLPRGYYLADPHDARTHGPLAPRGWICLDPVLYGGVWEAIEVAREHTGVVGHAPNDIRIIAERYPFVKMAATLPPRSYFRPTADIIDAWGIPVALAAKVHYVDSDGERRRGEALLLRAHVRGALQEASMSGCIGNVDSDAKAAWLSTRDIDRGLTWPLANWQAFSNPGLGHALELDVLNPHHTRAMEVELFLFYVGFVEAPPRRTMSELLARPLSGCDRRLSPRWVP